MSRNEKGTGSLYQAKDKTWVYQYNEDGKRRTRRFKKKAEQISFLSSRPLRPLPHQMHKQSIAIL